VNYQFFTLYTMLAVSLFSSLNSFAYEVSTHAVITQKAYEKSKLATSPNLAKRLGFVVRDKNDVFGTKYYDVNGVDALERFAGSPGFAPTTYELLILNPPALRFAIPPLSLPGWLARGAVREDDSIFEADKIPQDDPWLTGNLTLDNRPLHHFFDPYNNRALDILDARITPALLQKSPNWALGVTDFANGLNTPNTSRRNHFTIVDAREAMWRALTLKRKFNGAIEDIDTSSNTAQQKEEIRKAYWATTFRAIGSVLHHIQDMAQPQHTRNDPHAGDNYGEGQGGLLGHKSFYETDGTISNVRTRSS
jgi:hypothetical protein